jgi:hypothetical protein
MKILEFFQEGDGQLSNTRLNCTVMIWAGVGILVGGAFNMGGAKLDANTISAAMGLIVAGSGTKLIQKTQENTSDSIGVK